MRTLEVGSNTASTPITACTALPDDGVRPLWVDPATGQACMQVIKSRGFTLIELLVVVAIIASASAGVTFAMRDSAQTRLEREAQRLAALLESARAQSRSSGIPVIWRVTAAGFRFDGLAPDALPQNWIGEPIAVRDTDSLLLGPEPIIGKQAIVLSAGATGQSLRIATDGIRPFAIQANEP